MYIFQSVWQKLIFEVYDFCISKLWYMVKSSLFSFFIQLFMFIDPLGKDCINFIFFSFEIDVSKQLLSFIVSFLNNENYKFFEITVLSSFMFQLHNINNKLCTGHTLQGSSTQCEQKYYFMWIYEDKYFCKFLACRIICWM